MIKILINQEPTNFSNSVGGIDRAYKLTTEMEIQEDSDIAEALLAFVTALKIEGYRVTDKSMYQAIEDLIADYEIEELKKD